jgi:hypothetical protein
MMRKTPACGTAARALHVLLACTALAGTATWSPVAEATEVVCAARAGCWDSNEIRVTATSVRASRQGARQYVSATLRFVNKTARPMALAHLHNSLSMTDNRGNRYDQHGPVRGLPPFSGVNTRADFLLPPGGSREATVEFQVYLGNQHLAGDQFTLAVAVKEMTPVNRDQVEVGVEHAVALSGLVDGQTDMSALPAGSGAMAAQAAPAPQAACQGQPACFTEGPLLARVLQMRTMRNDDIDDEQHAAVFVQLSNRGDKPMALAYRLGTAQLIDNNGNPYVKHGPGDLAMVTGLAIATADGADLGFVIEPGGSRNVALRHRIERASKVRLGQRFSYELELLEFDPQVSQKSAPRREYLAVFRNIESQALAPKPKPKSGFEAYKDEQNREQQRFRESSGF